MGSSFPTSVAHLFMATLEDYYILNEQRNSFFGPFSFGSLY